MLSTLSVNESFEGECLDDPWTIEDSHENLFRNTLAILSDGLNSMHKKAILNNIMKKETRKVNEFKIRNKSSDFGNKATSRNQKPTSLFARGARHTGSVCLQTENEEKDSIKEDCDSSKDSIMISPREVKYLSRFRSNYSSVVNCEPEASEPFSGAFDQSIVPIMPDMRHSEVVKRKKSSDFTVKNLKSTSPFENDHCITNSITNIHTPKRSSNRRIIRTRVGNIAYNKSQNTSRTSFNKNLTATPKENINVVEYVKVTQVEPVHNISASKTKERIFSNIEMLLGGKGFKMEDQKSKQAEPVRNDTLNFSEAAEMYKSQEPTFDQMASILIKSDVQIFDKQRSEKFLVQKEPSNRILLRGDSRNAMRSATGRKATGVVKALMRIVN